MKRKKTRKIYVGDTPVGGDAPVTVQSMTNTKTTDIEATINQIKRLENKKCDIVRVAVPDKEAVKALREIKSRTHIPVIADIHFNYQLAIEAINQDIDGIRINPGNIGGKEKVTKIIQLAKKKQTAVRIGVNSGSLEKELLQKYRGPTAEALVESALKSIELFENMKFFDFKVSLKSSDVITTVRAYSLISEKTDCPLHLGITEAGDFEDGIIKSAVGIGSLLLKGIGDTLRVSLTADPVKEVVVGNKILKSLGLKHYGVDVISCPTCGRCALNIEEIVARVKEAVEDLDVPIKIAIMGCVVNGPGEAKEADIGIAGGKGKGVIFKKGKIIKRVKEKDIVKSLVNEIRTMV